MAMQFANVWERVSDSKTCHQCAMLQAAPQVASLAKHRQQAVRIHSVSFCTFAGVNLN